MVLFEYRAARAAGSVECSHSSSSFVMFLKAELDSVMLMAVGAGTVK